MRTLKPKRPTETQICKAIVARLRIEKPKCFWTHIANEQAMSGVDRKAAGRIGAIAKAMGKRKGVFDYLFLGMPTGYPIFWYEVKRDGCRPTPEQAEFMLYCDRRGIPCAWDASDDWMHHYNIIRQTLVRTEALK